ncbi:gustatory receptor 5a for trehalose-like [Teleopsis dalmanni]|uniref:gustatory receptor 5a for trehalose-like n=1 Tax=Teleopsis dalmanni TaxID=139649 RepID=UPI0018CCCEED|nr:gustatory receptor 5a for trehalose-like [Teleopsis dalmanni]
MSQFFALMPIKGVTAASPKQLSYSWKNYRNWYSLAYVLLTFIDLGFVLYKVLHGSITFNTIEPIIFHISIIIVTINTISLAKKWPKLMCYWSIVENNLPEYNSQYEKRRMAQKIKMVTFVGMTLSLGEHLLSTISVIHYSNFCPITTDKDPIKNFFLYFNDHIFFIFSYSHWLAFFGKFINVLLTFSWNYMDVFVMVISIGLASKFKQINDNLLNFKGMASGFRRGTRSDFIHNGSFHEAVTPALIIAQCFCLMPVRGINHKTAKGLSFSWKSFRTWMCLIYILTTLVDTCFTINMIVKSNVDARNIEPLIFHITILCASVEFMRLAVKWPGLMRKWERVEGGLPKFANWQEREELASTVKILLFVLVVLSLTEHLLSTISAIHYANYCPDPKHKDPVEAYFVGVSSQIFIVFDYSTWLAWLAKAEIVLMTFGWSYMDIFVIIVAIGLSSLFKQLQRHMVRSQKQYPSESFWTTSREQYRSICDLVEDVDDAISGITMISFANNLYSVCLQLLKSMNTMPSVAHAVYFYFSLSFLLARTLAVSLYLAEVNDRSLEPLKLIKCLSMKEYNTEVKRFYRELSTDLISLTGLKFFNITRKLLLTVAGTIVTYELVLLQFHEDRKGPTCVLAS